MADTLGQFFKEQKRHQDVVDPSLVTPPPQLSVPMPVQPLEASPSLSAPAPIGPLEKAPALSTPVAPGFEGPPKLSVPVAPGFEPAPPLDVPPVIPFEPAPPLDTPAVIPFEDAPPLSVPVAPGFEDAPPLSTPVAPGFEAAPPLSTPIAPTFEPPPPLSTPVAPGPEAAPPLSTPAQIVYPAVDVDTRRHSDDPAVRAAENGTGPQNSILSNLTSLDMGVNTSVMVPGLGMVPLNSHLSTHGGKVQAGFDLHLMDALNQRITQLKNTAKDAVAQLVSANVQNASKWATGQLASFAAGKGWRAGGPPIDSGGIDTLKANFNREALVDPTKSTLNPQGNLAQTSQAFADSAVSSSIARQAENLFTEDIKSEDWIPDAMDLRVVNDPTQGDTDSKRQSLAKLFEQESVSVSEFVDPLKSSFASLANSFDSNVESDSVRGFFRVQTTNADTRANTTPKDNDTYVPLVFTDLRPLQAGYYRSVYFRSFINSLSEGLAPNWNMQQFFGRVDPVATYQSTNRTINLGFRVVTTTPEELDINYKKLAWLKSMAYPQYDSRMQYYAGPVVRMRVGDIINAVGKEGNRGLAGVITNLQFNYGEGTWELLNGRRLPREISVDVSFHALHDTPVGLIRGTSDAGSETQFGGIELAQGVLVANHQRFHDAFTKTDYLNIGKGIEPEPIPNDVSGTNG